ncbi:MAG: hypothetical protein ACNI22_17135 [Halarcobacter sp.]
MFDNSFKEKVSTQFKLPDDAPLWVYNSKVLGNISQVGVSKNIKNDKYSFYRELALINASQNLAKKIYIKSRKILNDYYKKESQAKVFEKDINEHAKQIALKSTQKVKVINSFKSKDNTLFVQIVVDSKGVLKYIQESAKTLFKVNKIFENNFLSKDAETKLLKQIEN